MENIHCVSIILLLLTVLNKTTYTQDNIVGSQCTVELTGNPGTCKLSTDCPEVEEQAKRGLQITLCGRLHYNLPIVCCENTYHPQPNDGTFLSNSNTGSSSNIGSSDSGFNFRPSSGPSSNSGSSNFNNGGHSGEDSIIYPSDLNGNSGTTNQRQRISKTKCEEYNRPVTSTVAALPLLINSDPITHDVPKCTYNGVGLIVGGSPAGPGEFPYMAAIGFRAGNDWNWQCGGTLISERFVLTAAHCTFSREFGEPEVVRLGDIVLDSSDGLTHADYTIESIIVHPNYKYPKRYFDIALLKTSETVEFTSSIRPACLYQKENIDVTQAIATGWGSTAYLAENSDTLLKVTLEIYDQGVCQQTYPANKKDLPRGITSNMLCAGYLQGGRDTCQGDSGGPLIVTEPDNHCKFYIIGVTSFGKGCGIKNIPAVYTKVSEFISWIEENVW